MSDQVVIELDHIGVKFGQTIVHRDISLSVRQSEVVTVLGPSGAGKTVILKLIIGLLQPTSGSVRVFQQNLCELDNKQLNTIRMQIGMLFQGAALFDSLNVSENIAYGLREHGGYSEAQIDQIVADKLELINLPGIQKKYPAALSGGQKKRVGLARALASSPKVILFDEPTTGLDPTSVRLIDDLIIKLRDQYKITSIVVTHDIESAKRISDRWILIDQGAVLAQGQVADLINNNQDVQKFTSGHWDNRSAV